MASRRLSAGAPKREERLDPRAMAASMEEKVVQRTSRCLLYGASAASAITTRQQRPGALVNEEAWFQVPAERCWQTPMQNGRAAVAEQEPYASRARHAPPQPGPRSAGPPGQGRR